MRLFSGLILILISIITFLLLFVIYFLPTIIAFCRNHSYKWVIFGLNVFGFACFTWVISFIWAVWPKEKSLIDPIAGNVTGTGRRNSGDTIGAINYGKWRGYDDEKNNTPYTINTNMPGGPISNSNLSGTSANFGNSATFQQGHFPQAKFSLLINYKTFPLRDKSFLTNNEIPGLLSQNNNGIIAEVTQNPQDPNILGLKNLSYSSWIATLTTGGQKRIDPWRSIKLDIGTKIDFGLIQGEII